METMRNHSKLQRIDLIFYNGSFGIATPALKFVRRNETANLYPMHRWVKIVSRLSHEFGSPFSCYEDGNLRMSWYFPVKFTI